ncbi:hypothetical protein BST81_22325 [Leptolyngbya sp. 'hensonii']|uniref:CHAT domain-containing protein n=1 Tax=Leptolyngbya sp. 'hensonii' TaxID=1922337 RepID=UPI00094F7AF3|nr:CHAT domain-containing protein [Leptolyngbya sp. 'hensonii']OLP16143.1 hypothetical protein BST81_22325 [Leptolyngbya sp. 'hensonii']
MLFPSSLMAITLQSRPIVAPAPQPLWIAQTVIPATDGTNTIVMPNGNQFNITGGQLSADQINLFHSFLQFNLNSDQIANFLATPTLQNILGRVTGGDPSVINGLIQVTGGSPNLYLMNPAGIIFGSTAILNVPASFTATTATSIGFGNNPFGALKPNNYTALTGSPDRFGFQGLQPGAIVNSGNLTVGQNLTLIGGTVVSTGSLSAPNGQILISSVPGQSLVKLSQAGSPLSLEIQPSKSSPPLSVPIVSLPELLTGGTGSNATGLTVNNQGQVELTGSGLQIQSGDVVITQKIQAAGDVTVMANNAVRFREGLNGSLVVQSGSNLTIQGAQAIDILALNNLDQGAPFQSGGNLTLISNGLVSGDSHFNSGGNFAILTLAGQPGTFVSFYDPIITAPGSYTSGSYTGASLKVQAGGTITFTGDITINAPDATATGDPDSAILTGSRAVILRTTAGNISTGNITTFLTGDPVSGPVILQAPGNITVGNVNTSAASVTVPAIGGDVTILAGNNVTFTSINTQGIGSSVFPPGFGGDVTISAQQGVVQGTGVIGITANTINTSGFGAGTAGTIQIQQAGGPNNVPFIVGNAISNGTVGALFQSGVAAVNPVTVFPILPTTTTVTPSGSISITSSNNAPLISPAVITLPTAAGGSVSLPLASIISVLDPNGDVTQLILTSLPTQGTLTVGGVALTPGSPLSAGTLVVYSPFSNTTTPDSFTVQAADINDGSFTSPLSFSNPGVINLQIQSQNDDPRNSPPGNLEGSRLDLKPFCGLSDVGFITAEEKFKSAYEKYSGSVSSAPTSSADSACQLLAEVEDGTGIKPALIYVSFVPVTTASLNQGKTSPSVSGEAWVPLPISLRPEDPDSGTGRTDPSLRTEILVQAEPEVTPKDTDQLELIVLTAKGQPFRKRLPITRTEVLRIARKFRSEVSNPSSTNYLEPAQQLYQWLIDPLEPELQKRQVKNLVFLMDRGLRSLPIAALHNGRNFIIEQYSVGLMPTISLTDTRRTNIQDAEVLAMGASEFRDQNPLPAVPLELAVITQKLRRGKLFLNAAFTPSALVAERRRDPVRIVHLATHSEFRPGSPENSFIQFWDRKIRLNEIRQLALNNPPVDLLVLSSCRTALGDEEAELGFAGLAIQAGVKTAMASLWYVSDEGTLGLMTEFYEKLKTGSIKAEVLQQAQISLLQGKVRIADGRLMTDTIAGNLLLPPELQNLGDQSLAHPYYWAGFTLIGNPW